MKRTPLGEVGVWEWDWKVKRTGVVVVVVEEGEVVVEGGGGGRWGASLPYRRPGRDTSSRGLAADTCVLASDTCLCKWSGRWRGHKTHTQTHTRTHVNHVRIQHPQVNRQNKDGRRKNGRNQSSEGAGTGRRGGADAHRCVWESRHEEKEKQTDKGKEGGGTNKQRLLFWYVVAVVREQEKGREW